MNMVPLKCINVTIIVFMFVTISYAVDFNENNQPFHPSTVRKEDVKAVYRSCIDEMASKFKVIEKDEETGYYKRENLNLLSMVKYAIKNLKKEENTNPSLADEYYLILHEILHASDIQIPSKFCYEKVLCLAGNDYSKIDAKLRANCYTELMNFPTNLSKTVLKYALYEIVLEDFNGQNFGTSYMNHLIENVNIISNRLDEPEDFCLFVACDHFGVHRMYFGLSETDPGDIIKY